MDTTSPTGNYDLTTKQLHAILHRREWTYLIDLLCAYLISAAINFSINRYVISTEIFPYGDLLGLAYIILKDSFNGKSIGKAMTGLRVIHGDSGKPIGLGKSLMRNFLFLIPIFPLVELIVANIRKDKKRLGDLMAATMVVRP